MRETSTVIASEAKQSSCAPAGALGKQMRSTRLAQLLFGGALRARLDCRVASLLAMTGGALRRQTRSSRLAQSFFLGALARAAGLPRRHSRSQNGVASRRLCLAMTGGALQKQMRS